MLMASALLSLTTPQAWAEEAKTCRTDPIFLDAVMRLAVTKMIRNTPSLSDAKVNPSEIRVSSPIGKYFQYGGLGGVINQYTIDQLAFKSVKNVSLQIPDANGETIDLSAVIVIFSTAPSRNYMVHTEHETFSEKFLRDYFDPFLPLYACKGMCDVSSNGKSGEEEELLKKEFVEHSTVLIDCDDPAVQSLAGELQKKEREREEPFIQAFP